MSLQWERLVGQGRAKDIGIPWQEDELTALYEIAKKANISVIESARYVRQGVKSFDEYQKAQIPPSREDIEKTAAEVGIQFAPETPQTVLEKEIERKIGVNKIAAPLPIDPPKKIGRPKKTK